MHSGDKSYSCDACGKGFCTVWRSQDAPSGQSVGLSRTRDLLVSQRICTLHTAVEGPLARPAPSSPPNPPPRPRARAPRVTRGARAAPRTRAPPAPARAIPRPASRPGCGTGGRTRRVRLVRGVGRGVSDQYGGRGGGGGALRFVLPPEAVLSLRPPRPRCAPSLLCHARRWQPTVIARVPGAPRRAAGRGRAPPRLPLQRGRPRGPPAVRAHKDEQKQERRDPCGARRRLVSPAPGTARGGPSARRGAG